MGPWWEVDPWLFWPIECGRSDSVQALGIALNWPGLFHWNTYSWDTPSWNPAPCYEKPIHMERARAVVQQAAPTELSAASQHQPPALGGHCASPVEPSGDHSPRLHLTTTTWDPRWDSPGQPAEVWAITINYYCKPLSFGVVSNAVIEQNT